MSFMLKYRVLQNPIPIPALRYVNTYLVLGDNCCIVVDPGLGRDCAERVMEASRGCSVELVVATHFHVDHSTAAAYIDARLAMGEREWRHVEWMVDTWPLALESMKELFLAHGMPRGEAEELSRKHPALSRIGLFQDLVDRHRRDKLLLRDGDTITVCGTSIRVIDAPGHTPGHILLAHERLLFVGDTVLGDITPNIPLLSWSHNPLRDYLATLQRIEEQKPELLLPGHRRPISEPAKRIEQLRAHHHRRLEEVLDIICRLGEATAYEVAANMHWDVPYTSWADFPLAQKYFAHAEALSHAKLLVESGVLEEARRGNIIYLRAADRSVCEKPLGHRVSLPSNPPRSR